MFLLAVFLLTVACAGEQVPVGSNILLITIDTLRADHLSGYGYPRRTSPILDRLAAEGVRFDQASVQWPKTGPSFASMFTSTYPKDNGIVRRIGIPLPEEFLMLAEMLQAKGYATAAVVANGAVGSDFNFDQGFAQYAETWKGREEIPEIERDRADVVNRLAKELVAGLDRDVPFFLWIHYLDPHFPYQPPAEWADRFQDDEWFDPSVHVPVRQDRERQVVGRIGTGQVLDGRTELDFYRARYDAEIAYVDDQIGDLLAHMDDGGWLEGTLTVVTSDHGESLGEHGYYFDHGRLGFQTCLRVPLIFHYPGWLEPSVVEEPVELLGLAPTLLEVAGVELDAGTWMQGRSFLPRLQGAEDERSPYVFSEAGYGQDDRWQKIVRNRRFKLVYALEGAAQRWITGGLGNTQALYDLIDDPEETVNVLAEYPSVAERLTEVLTRWSETSFDAMVASTGEQQLEGIDEATRKQLKALGYLD